MEDRFQRMVHREARKMPVYALRVGKNGPRLALHTGGAPAPTDLLRMGCGSLSIKKGSRAALAIQLSLPLGRMVIDKTVLEGDYDFELGWMPEAGQGRTEAFGLPPVALDTPPDPNGPSIFTALQEQLGLKLESHKGPVEVRVIDHVEKASEN
jgi:uncharacterized protein (TIGR03435 family)